MTEFVLPLASAGDPADVGGKGASLGELSRAGVAVPPGFAVTTTAFRAAIDAIDPGGELRAQVEALPAADLGAIARVSAAVREKITAAPLPASLAAAITTAYAALGPAGADPDVAVRSSATMEDSSAASFAGLQDSYLGVAGAVAVLGHVRRCWASMYNDESVTYRRRLAMPEQSLGMAVVVQLMVRPRAAGVMFTRSPVTGDRSVVAIEGTWGLGSALVAGDVTPDSFVISKITGEITGRRVSAKDRIHSYVQNGHGVAVADTPADLRSAPCLADEEIRALAAIAGRVEAHYGVPQDIEWALLEEPLSPAVPPAAGSFGQPASPAPAASGTERIVLLQSRPETVWAARAAAPVAAPKARPADHVLALFGKPL
ncbi:PEP/pyruvate-binding domain-containing protein [Trebonia sp.]|uniref:PEP/pyruvate-binding domain-containing protein n=1 Tax=Trebonia sp. TaxID=2767075 RepID=UPI00261854F7|nr:PEP/pyruvate-binding domain-containing protein [Trebonia sp.]